MITAPYLAIILSRTLRSHAEWRQPSVPSQSLDRRSCSVDNPFAAGPAPALPQDRASLRDGLVPPAAGGGRAPAPPRSPSAPGALSQAAARAGADEAAARGRPDQAEPHARSHSEGDGGGLRSSDGGLRSSVGGAAVQGGSVRGAGTAGPAGLSAAAEPGPPPQRADADGRGEAAQATEGMQERPPGSASRLEAAAPQLLPPPAGQQQQAAPPQPIQARAQAQEQAPASLQLERPAQLPQPPLSEASPASEHDAAHPASGASAEAAPAQVGNAVDQAASQPARGSPKPAAPGRSEPGGPGRPARPEGGEAAGRVAERRPSSKAERRELQERQKAAKEAARKVHQASRRFCHACCACASSWMRSCQEASHVKRFQRGSRTAVNCMCMGFKTER